MWTYNHTDELYHYGVLGMKWGVRRASKRLSNATTKEDRDSAISSLNKHKGKATRKIEKLDKKGAKLQKKVDKNAQKGDVKAAKYERKAAKYRRKSIGLFVSEGKAQKLLQKATVMNIKAADIKARSNEVKAKLEKNRTLKRLFESGISDIDKALSRKLEHSSLQHRKDSHKLDMVNNTKKRKKESGIDKWNTPEKIAQRKQIYPTSKVGDVVRISGPNGETIQGKITERDYDGYVLWTNMGPLFVLRNGQLLTINDI